MIPRLPGPVQVQKQLLKHRQLQQQQGQSHLQGQPDDRLKGGDRALILAQQPSEPEESTKTKQRLENRHGRSARRQQGTKELSAVGS
jgi:hypothetical protein